ncbi:MAG: hypothetical protein N2485_02745 [bacterium]|nr:hypothetical protein [bacterium]
MNQNKIYTSGNIINNNNNTSATYVVRLNPDLTIDPTFGVEGKLLIDTRNDSR